MNKHIKIAKQLIKIANDLISINEDDIKSIDDLKSFYNNCSYGLIDFSKDKSWKEVNGEPSDDDYDNNWKLLSTEQLLKYRCGICFDTAKMNDYFLTKWHIPHINLFAYTKRSLNDDNTNDPTHAFTVYKDNDGKWKWIEGSWENYKNNDWSDVSFDNLIKRIGEALAHDLKQTYLIVIIHNFPEAGVNMDDFFESLKDDINHPIFEIAYKSSYRKSSKLKTASIDIVPIRNENEEDLNLILEGCNLDSIASGDELWSIQDVKEAINGKYKDFFLLHSGDDIIGMCTISGNALSGFAIFPEYQGKGYGKQSLKAIIKKMRETNKEIILRVAVNNTRAVNLYKSLVK